MTIGLVAADGKKNLMENLCIAYRAILAKHELYATETTGLLIEKTANLKVHKYTSGYLGGVQKLNADIETNRIDMVIDFLDPDKEGLLNPEERKMINSCIRYNIPIATNLPTAEILILALTNGGMDWREMYH